MHRTTQLVVAAGVAGAVFATVLGQLFTTPAVASSGWSAAEARTATVDVLSLLERMLDTEPYASERDSATQMWNGQIQPLVEQRTGVEQSLQALDPTNPDAAAGQALYNEYQGLQQRINMLGQQAQVEMDRMSAGHLADAYSRIHAAVQVTAEAQGYDRVFSSRMSADDLNAENTNVVVQEVLLRPLLRDATGTDITELVRAELGIPEVAPEVEGPAVEPGAEPVVDPAAPTEGDG